MWWLIILFGVIIFSIIYWVVIDDRSFSGGFHESLEAKLDALATKRLASSIDVTNDTSFTKWPPTRASFRLVKPLLRQTAWRATVKISKVASGSI